MAMSFPKPLLSLGKASSLFLPSLAALLFTFQSKEFSALENSQPTPTKTYLSSNNVCMYTLNTYSGTPFSNANLFDVDGSSGTVSGPVATGLEATIGLEMDAIGDLYTVELKDVPFVGVVTKLHRINSTTGAATFIGDLGIMIREGDLALHPITEDLYGVSSDGTLFTIDTATGLATVIGTISSPNGTHIEISYLTFDLSGNLYAMDNGNSTTINSYWLEVDPGTASLISSNLVLPKVEDPGGMDVNPETGEIFLLESDGSPGGAGPFQLYTVNPATGARSSVGPLINNQGYSGLAICGPPPPCTSPPPGMVAWWSFDEPNTIGGSPLYATLDYSSSAPNTGIRSGAASFGGELTLNGGHVDTPDHSELNFGVNQDFSIDAWIRTSSKAWNQTILDKRKNGGSPGYLLTLYNGRLLLQIADSSGYSNFWSGATPQFHDGDWHFVAVSVDRDNPSGIRMYADGNLIATFNPTGRSGSLANKSVLRIGKHAYADINRFTGQIDEVEIFNRVVGESEFDSIYDAGETGKCKPCMAETAFLLEQNPSNIQASSLAILANMRRFRDVLMPQTQTGRYFAEIYQAYNMRAAWLLVRDGNLRGETVALLRKYHPVFLDMVQGKASYMVTQEMVADGKQWLNMLQDADLNHAGSGELANAIQQESQAIDWQTITNWRVQDLLKYHDH